MARQPRVDPAWQNLAGLLIHRRVQLDPRYRNRRTFCDEKQIEYRVVSDIEGARRSNFSAPMLTALEVAYDIPDGGIKQALTDPTLKELPRRNTSPTSPRRASPHASNTSLYIPADVHLADLEPWEQHIWRTPDLTANERRGLIRFGRLQLGMITDDVESLLLLSDTLSQAIARHLAARQDPPAPRTDAGPEANGTTGPTMT